MVGGVLELKIAEMDCDWILEFGWSTSALFAGAAALVGLLVGGNGHVEVHSAREGVTCSANIGAIAGSKLCYLLVKTSQSKSQSQTSTY